MIIFVADAFVEHYVGGAELTTEALMSDGLPPVFKALSSQINVSIMEEHRNLFWVFANFANLSDECLLYAIKNLNYSVLEYDYKFCKYRSIEKHVEMEGSCDCQNSKRGKLVSMLLNSSKMTWWMSEKQKKIYREIFPFLSDENNKVLTSILSDETLDFIENCDTSQKDDKWIILNSKSWIKGVNTAVEYAKDNGLNYELVWGLEHHDLLKKLAKSKGLIFLPPGGDTCPRLVLEAKLLDCELVLNDNVQHKNEKWFSSKESTLSYLRGRSEVFWSTFENVQNLGLPKEKTFESDNRYKIIVPFYNAERWLPKCIKSIKRQNYKNYECILVDDVSTDNSYEMAKKNIAGDPRFKLIRSKEKNFALKNISNSIDASKCNDEDIIILLDGDDWFSSSCVLSHLNKVYDDKDSLMTYGSYIYFPYSQKGVEPSEYPQEVIDSNRYREDRWRASHLRTFKYSIWKKIDKDDLKDNNNKFYKMTYDQAIMLPLLEMSGDRATYISDILHVYNKANPLNVDKLKAEEQSRLAVEIRQKEKYKRL